MVLYVIRPPNPPAGTDWLATVPGQYLYDIAGITANLATQAGGATVAHDSSGNGRDGTYHGGNNTGWFVPGLVAGDAAFLTGTLISGSKFWISSPFAAVQWSAPWSFACWFQVEVTSAGLAPVLMDAFVGPSNPGARVQLNAGANGALQVDSQLSTWRTATGLGLKNGTTHFVCVVWDGATLVAYLDGALVAWAFTAINPGVDPPNLAPTMGTANSVVSNTQINIDEWTVWDSAISAGDVAAMHSAASVSFPAYTAAVLATSPAIYYHLDDGALGVGRQVTLEVTNGSDTTELIPTGFPIAGALGSYAYSWQPKLGASAQTADGAQTTVAIPQLILPAGYTVGARTLDLGGADQWSDVVIWWDSSIMDSEDHVFDYHFAPGWKMDYHYDPNAA